MRDKDGDIEKWNTRSDFGSTACPRRSRRVKLEDDEVEVVMVAGKDVSKSVVVPSGQLPPKVLGIPRVCHFKAWPTAQASSRVRLARLYSPVRRPVEHEMEEAREAGTPGACDNCHLHRHDTYSRRHSLMSSIEHIHPLIVLVGPTGYRI